MAENVFGTFIWIRYAIEDYAFQSLRSLRSLHLAQNQLITLQNLSSHDMRGLHTLHLDGNNLIAINDFTFLSLNQLGVLKISNNKLRAINQNTFAGLSGLIKLVINYNEIEHMNEESFTTMPHLQYVEMFGSKIKCSCAYIKLLKSLSMRSLQADCRYGDDRFSNVIRPTSLEFTDWEMWTDCETGRCLPGPHMRTAMCKSCSQTNSLLCTSHNPQNCMIIDLVNRFDESEIDCRQLEWKKSDSDDCSLMYMVQLICLLFVLLLQN